jgi:hypothetical protein
LLADDKLAELAGWDEELRDLLAEQDDVAPGLTDEDAAPETPEHPVSQPVDVLVLGNHRVLCGDATHRDHVQRLMTGEHADLVFTDPPYSIDYEGCEPARGGTMRLDFHSERLNAPEFELGFGESCNYVSRGLAIATGFSSNHAPAR